MIIMYLLIEIHFSYWSNGLLTIDRLFLLDKFDQKRNQSVIAACMATISILYQSDKKKKLYYSFNCLITQKKKKKKKKLAPDFLTH